MTSGVPPDRPANVDTGDHDQRDTPATLDALQLACTDTSLAAPLRDLLVRASHALQAAELSADSAQQRYRALFDAVPDPVSVLDEKGVVLDLNKAGMAAYQLTRQQIVGQPIERLNPDLPKNHLAPVWEALNRGQSYVIEVTNKRGDGTRFPVEVHSAGFFQDGKRCIVAVARDLSERHEAELKFRELFEAIDTGVIVQDVDGLPVQVNAAALRILGVEDGSSFADYVRPENWRVLDESGRQIERDEWPFWHTLRTGQAMQSTVLGMYHLPERHLRWLAVTTVPVFAPGSAQPRQVISLFSDVTELKRDSALFDRAQELAHIGGWEWEIARDRLYLTDEALRILGQSRPPQSMRDMTRSLRATDARRLQAALAATSGSASGFDLQLQGSRSDGSVFWMRLIGEADPGANAATRITGTLQDITGSKQAEETLRVQARTDPLTGLMNRDAVLGELNARLADTAQNKVAVLYIDLDRFKVVNDVSGHSAGDELLVAAARRINGAVGTEGLVARCGGDEFLVVCGTHDDSQRPERLAAAILDAFGDGFRFEHLEFSITASIGVARAPQDGGTPQVLIQNADVAMYESKRRIRNGWQAFTPALARIQQDRLRIETHLRRAADKGELHLVYQPQIDLRNGRIIAAEALIRWQHRQFGEMRPDRFISHAESTGDIVGIGSWVLREACRQVAQWRDAGLGVVRIAVNVSYRQFFGQNLAETVSALLDEFRLPGAALELEFTERVLIEDAPDTVKAFADLRDLGIVLTIDDFGEGYSALNYLRRLPVHGLKLSQLFVAGIPGNKSDVAVCEAVSGIARSLRLGLVAEGVESEVQRQLLLRMGIPVGQGFLFAPGLPADEFALRLDGSHEAMHV